MAFAHLHVHTHYSFLDGAIRIPDLAAATKAAGMTAVAMTDRGNMYGAVEMQKQCEKSGVKPIFGCEVAVVEKDRCDPKDKRTTSLVLLAESLEGYKNLLAVVSHGWLEGYAGDVPRVDRALIEAHRAGLIALSGGLAGDVSQAVLRRDLGRARELAAGWRDLLGEGNFFLQIEDLGFQECRPINEALAELAGDLGIGVVATSGVRYLKPDDARAHAALVCIGLGKSFHGIQGRIPEGLWLRPEADMREAFRWVPEAVDNAGAIAERCNVKIPLGKTFLPSYKVPEGITRADYLRERAREGLARRFANYDAHGVTVDRPGYEARLEEELGIIITMDFPGYFLIVWDFIAKAKELGCPVGPGRGSGAGSLVAWALSITDIDPIRYGLLFERFLNPERVSMPDFDIDFCMNKRGVVIDYVTEKYGQHNVGQIITYGALKAKAALRDVGRVLELSFGEVDRIAKLIPEELGITLADALKKEPRIEALFAEDARYRELYDMARKLENLYRHAGMHAAGVVISEEPLWHYVPICRGANGEIVTQFAKDEVEYAGLVKFDFLGLKTLTVLDHAVRLVNESRAQRGEAPVDLSAIPMDDKAVFELLSSGETTGVFQLESSGFKELMKKLRPDCFEDIIAAVALYRPGPLQSGMVDKFVKCKHGEEAVAYPHPALEECLRETYGVIVYQEQVMNIARVIAGYSLGGADLLRRAMGKKKAEEMAKQRAIFVAGAEKTGHCGAEKAGEIFELMEYFAGYGFNKSHSAAYALITYQTAWLKTHYAVEFMAALLTADGDNTDKVVRYIGDARAMGIVVRPPDVNLSQKAFSVDAGGIRFGLGAIKNVGEGAVDTILAGREQSRYPSLFEFCERVDLKRLNRRVLEALVKSGACDGFGEERHVLYHNIDRALERGQTMARDRESGQTTLFSLFGGLDTPKKAAAPGVETYAKDVEVWTDKQRLGYEKEAIGFFISGHPLDRYQAELKRYATATTSELESVRGEIALGGIVAAIRERPLKSGNGRMGFVTIEDLRGQVEVIFFGKAFAESEQALKSDEPLLVTGSVQLEGDEDNRVLKVRASKAVRLSDVRRDRTQRVALRINAEVVPAGALGRLRDVCRAHPGQCSLTALVEVPGNGTAVISAPETVRVDPGDEFIAAAERLLGRGCVVLAS